MDGAVIGPGILEPPQDHNARTAGKHSAAGIFIEGAARRMYHQCTYCGLGIDTPEAFREGFAMGPDVFWSFEQSPALTAELQ